MFTYRAKTRRCLLLICFPFCLREMDGKWMKIIIIMIFFLMYVILQCGVLKKTDTDYTENSTK